jgi:pimeloyl-ACP methyl ester carboxylesterase
VTPRYVRAVAGIQVTAEQVRVPLGEPAGTLGLVHGLGENSTVWNRLVQRLPEDIAVWNFGLPWDAAGGMQWALEREPRVWLEHALALAPVVPEVLVAHSFGASCLLDHLCRDRCAGPRSAGLRGLMLVSPFYRATPQGFDWGDLRHYVNDFDDLLRHGLEALRGDWAPPAPDLMEAMVEKVRDRIGPYGWLRFFEMFSRTPMLDLDAIDLPTLVIGGERDTASYPADCRSLAQALPRARAEILPRCGHFPMVDHPDRMVALLDDFLRGPDRPHWPYEPVCSTVEGALS